MKNIIFVLLIILTSTIASAGGKTVTDEFSKDPLVQRKLDRHNELTHGTKKPVTNRNEFEDEGTKELRKLRDLGPVVPDREPEGGGSIHP